MIDQSANPHIRFYTGKSQYDYLSHLNKIRLLIWLIINVNLIDRWRNKTYPTDSTEIIIGEGGEDSVLEEPDDEIDFDCHREKNGKSTEL